MGAKDLQVTTEETGLAPLFRRLEALNDEGKFREELKDVIAQLGQAVTDLVAHIESSDPKAAAEQLAKALGAIKLAAPQVTVEPKIALECSIPPAPAPVIHLIDRPSGDETWEVRIKGAFGAADKVMTITRRAASVPPKRLPS